MKVIAINGSPRANGNTAGALAVMTQELAKEGIETEILSIGKEVRGCVACGACRKLGRCVFDDDLVNRTADEIAQADGFILGCPTYYAGIPGTMKSFLDRLFYSHGAAFQYKVATAAAVVRRTGGLDVVHQLHNYLSLAKVVLPPSQYWTVAYGAAPGEVAQDAEGLQTLRRNAQAMAWLLKIIDATRGTVPLPPDEQKISTNFIR